ncbi:MAG TPA: hypothetical protein EYO33_28050 [Phycisphaerales bacterium]|nr:hypothetical protein [Phycisphaerales bacterium]
MGKNVDSQALEGLNRALGLAGPGSGQTTLEDGELIQTIDGGQIARRSRGIASPLSGWFTGIMENDHGAGTTSLETRINPYTTVFQTQSPLPGAGQAISDAYDWWLIGLSLIQHGAGTASNFTNGCFVLDTGNAVTAFMEDDSSATAHAQNADFPMVMWDDLATVGGLGVGIREDGNLWTPLNLRIPQHSPPIFSFRSTAANAITVRCNLLLGLFPAQLGQDVSF